MSSSFSAGKSKLSVWATFAATLVVAMALAAAPASAKLTTTVKLVKHGSGKTLSIHGAGSGDQHVIDVRPGANSDYVVSDITATVKPSGGCAPIFAGSSYISCPKAGVNALDIVSGSTNDYVYSRDVSLTGSVKSGSGNDTIELSSQSDIPTRDQVVLAGNGEDHITTGNGDDKIYAGKNNDQIDGGDGKDRLVGDDGDDYIDAVDSPGHAAVDTVYCGKGTNDVADVNGSIDDDGVVTLFDDIRTNSFCETVNPFDI